MEKFIENKCFICYRRLSHKSEDGEGGWQIKAKTYREKL